MTYLGFLFRFVFIPILILSGLTCWDLRQQAGLPRLQEKLIWRVIIIHIGLALVYTTPWDNYLVASGVWFYNPRLVTGVVIGWVPLEEYTFFVVETLLSGLWWVFLARRLPDAGVFRPSRAGRLVGFGFLFVIWLLCIGLFFSGWKPGTYLSITLCWALPAIFPQFLFGADILWHQRWLVFWAIVPMSLYLSLADMAALKATTWSISADQTIGMRFLGILPLEEIVFFFVTNTLIAFGMTLMLSNTSQQRLADWRARSFRGLP